MVQWFSLRVGVALILGSVGSASAWARGYSAYNNYVSSSEDLSMISNGQGVSSPSFSEGLAGQNPAGLTWNRTFKIQADAASFDNSLNNTRGSVGFLAGDGIIGGGLSYTTYNASPLAPGAGQINWGLGGYLSSWSTGFGVSGHNSTQGGGGTYDLGTLIDLSHDLRFGLMLASFNTGFHNFGAGLSYSIDPALDLVFDTGWDLGYQYGTAKPGMTLHADRFQVALAYGFHLMGAADALLYTGFTAGLGIRITQYFCLEYEYQALPTHQLGLTLKL